MNGPLDFVDTRSIPGYTQRVIGLWRRPRPPYQHQHGYIFCKSRAFTNHSPFHTLKYEY